MAEEQAAHRRALESRVIAGNVAAECRGQVFAFTLALVTLVGATPERRPANPADAGGRVRGRGVFGRMRGPDPVLIRPAAGSGRVSGRGVFRA